MGVACILLLQVVMELKWASALPVPVIIGLLVLLTMLVSVPAFPLTR